MKKIFMSLAVALMTAVFFTSCGNDPVTKIIEDTPTPQEQETSVTEDEEIVNDDNSTAMIMTKNNQNIQGIWSYDRSSSDDTIIHYGYYAFEFYATSDRGGVCVYYELDAKKNMTYYKRGKYSVGDAKITISNTDVIDGSYNYTYTSLDGNKVINVYVNGEWCAYKAETSFGGMYYNN